MRHLLFALLLLPVSGCLTIDKTEMASSPTEASQAALQRISYVTNIPSSFANFALTDLEFLIRQQKPAHLLLGHSRQGRKVEAWYFPGQTDRRALVIGGMHGSELSSIEVATALIRELIREQPYYSVVVIPSLFPDNAAAAMDFPEEAGSVLNIGRYSHSNGVDPNRQMPSPGKAFSDAEGRDHLDRVIEAENQFLLQLIQYFRPSRIANLHAIRNTGYGGIYADPRTDHLGTALGYASDSSLAVEMAQLVDQQDGNVAGNHLDKKPTALYYKDPTPSPKGLFQRRNMTGSALKAHRGSGVSLGTWGTTAVRDEKDDTKNRDAMRVITVEFPGAKRSVDYKSITQQAVVRRQIIAFAQSIHLVFLGNYFVEDESGMEI